MVLPFGSGDDTVVHPTTSNSPRTLDKSKRPSGRPFMARLFDEPCFWIAMRPEPLQTSWSEGISALSCIEYDVGSSLACIDCMVSMDDNPPLPTFRVMNPSTTGAGVQNNAYTGVLGSTIHIQSLQLQNYGSISEGTTCLVQSLGQRGYV